MYGRTADGDSFKKQSKPSQQPSSSAFATKSQDSIKFTRQRHSQPYLEDTPTSTPEQLHTLSRLVASTSLSPDHATSPIQDFLQFTASKFSPSALLSSFQQQQPTSSSTPVDTMMLGSGRHVEEEKELLHADEIMSQTESSDAMSDDSEEGSELGDEEDEDDVEAWISWFCSLQGHEYLFEVEESFIEDEFNLTGLSSLVPFYTEAIDAILDIELEGYTEQELQVISESAEILYLLIHQRFIQSRVGTQALYERYANGDFEQCPRVLCDGQHLVPVGLSDYPGRSTLKLFCIRCLDIYDPATRTPLDGCAFGTTAAHLMFQSNEEARQALKHGVKEVYVPKVFGFRVHESAVCGSRMQWLRGGEDVKDSRPLAEGGLASSMSLADNGQPMDDED